MGRRRQGTEFFERRPWPNVFVPGRRAWWLAGMGASEATVLCVASGQVRIWDHRDKIVEAVDARRLRLTAGDVPRRWTDARGYDLVYLGRRHPLANRAGRQYVHRLVALGLTRRRLKSVGLQWLDARIKDWPSARAITHGDQAGLHFREEDER